MDGIFEKKWKQGLNENIHTYVRSMILRSAKLLREWASMASPVLPVRPARIDRAHESGHSFVGKKVVLGL